MCNEEEDPRTKTDGATTSLKYNATINQWQNGVFYCTYPYKRRFRLWQTDLCKTDVKLGIWYTRLVVSVGFSLCTQLSEQEVHFFSLPVLERNNLSVLAHLTLSREVSYHVVSAPLISCFLLCEIDYVRMWPDKTLKYFHEIAIRRTVPLVTTLTVRQQSSLQQHTKNVHNKVQA